MYYKKKTLLKFRYLLYFLCKIGKLSLVKLSHLKSIYPQSIKIMFLARSKHREARG